VNGDGMLIYPGPDITPVSSIRLEIIRDGIEDYEYLALLSRLVTQSRTLPGRKQPREVLRRAEDLLTVPAEMSRSMTEFTKDPDMILERRRAIADAIESLTRALGTGA